MPVTRNFGPLDQIPLTDAQLMREVGLMVRERIVRRTRAGEGVDGAFQPYSASYAAQKRKALGGSGTVNLTASGAMLNAIVLTKVTDDEVEIGFSS